MTCHLLCCAFVPRLWSGLRCSNLQGGRALSLDLSGASCGLRVGRGR